MKFLPHALLILLIFNSPSVFCNPQVPADGIVGVWLVETDEEATEKIEIYEKDGLFHGRIVWARPSVETGKPALDVENKNEELRTRPLEGLEILRGYKFDGVDSWEDGEFYAYKKGKNVSPKLTLTDENHLKIQVKILFFSKTFVWPRVQPDQPGNSSES